MQTGMLRTSAWTGEIEGVPVTLLRPDWGISSLFRGGAIYGGSHSELEAYLYFSRWAHVETEWDMEACSSATARNTVHHNRTDITSLIEGAGAKS